MKANFISRSFLITIKRLIKFIIEILENIIIKILQTDFHRKKTLSSNSFRGLLFVYWTLTYSEKNGHYFLVTSRELFMKPFLSNQYDFFKVIGKRSVKFT